MADKYWKSKTKINRVIKTNHKPKKGFYSMLGMKIGGYHQMSEELIEEQFEECSKEEYEQQKYLKET